MSVGIIVFSKTGHTLSVATQLRERLAAAGHAAMLERVETAGSGGFTAQEVVLKTAPSTKGYDAVVFGSPLWGGMVPPPVVSYLEQIDSLEGKDLVCLVTHFFPAKWGGNKALGQMVETCTSKGATVRGSGSVQWLSLSRKKKAAQLVEELANSLGA